MILVIKFRNRVSVPFGSNSCDMKRIAFALTFLGLPMMAFAHPGHGGHGDSGWTIIHYVSTPEHALPLVATAMLAIAAVWMFRRARRVS